MFEIVVALLAILVLIKEFHNWRLITELKLRPFYADASAGNLADKRIGLIEETIKSWNVVTVAFIVIVIAGYWLMKFVF